MRALHLLPALLLLACASATAGADTLHITESAAVDELWLNAGFYSYHFQQDRDLDNSNIGLGFEYRYSTVNSLTAGRFHNSDRQMSNYAAWYWQPVSWGPVRLGALLGAIDGYPKANNGNWFPMLLPVGSYDYKSLGVSFTIIPTYQEMLHGSITVQLRLKLY